MQIWYRFFLFVSFFISVNHFKRAELQRPVPGQVPRSIDEVNLNPDTFDLIGLYKYVHHVVEEARSVREMTDKLDVDQRDYFNETAPESVEGMIQN